MSSRDVDARSLPPSNESHCDEEEEASEEEEEEEESEEEDLREYGLAPSLPTTTAEAFAEPSDGDGDGGEIVVDESEGFSAALRYLASVRLEAKTVPQIVVAEPREREEREREGERETSTADRHREQAPSFHSPPTSSSSPAASASGAVSLADPWLQAFLDDFAELRREITEAREVEHRDAWRLGAVEGKRRTEGDEAGQLPRSWRAALGLLSRQKRDPEQQQQQQPRRRNLSARFLASLPQPEIVEALECVAEAVREFLEEEEETEEEKKKEADGDGKNGGEGFPAVVVTPAVALWTFSLAANLERPVPPHASAALCALGKAAGAEAKRLRRGREKEEKEEEEEEEEEEERAAAAAAAAEEDDIASSPPPSFLAASSPCPHAAVVAAVCGAYFVQCEELSKAAKEGWP